MLVENGVWVAVEAGMEVLVAAVPPRGVLVDVPDPEGGEIQPENAEMTLSSEHNRQATSMNKRAITIAKMISLREALLSSAALSSLYRLNIQTPQPQQIKVRIQHL